MLNANRPQLWKADIAASVDLYNRWFLQFAPATFRSRRAGAVADVTRDMLATKDLTDISAGSLLSNPAALPVLRMCCCPPIARERLAGLAGVSTQLVKSLEAGKVPRKMAAAALHQRLTKLADVLTSLLDVDFFPWLPAGTAVTATDRDRAASVVADRLCGSLSDPIIRNAQEQRQLDEMVAYLTGKGYVKHQPAAKTPLTQMLPGTFAVRMVVATGQGKVVNVPIDVVVQPAVPRPTKLPVLFELKSAGDFTNVNKRRKEEAKKMGQLKAHLGPGVEYILFLCGYFNAGYLGYEAAEGIDRVWEHRISDLDALGL
jgi:hypothetical protein